MKCNFSHENVEAANFCAVCGERLRKTAIDENKDLNITNNYEQACLDLSKAIANIRVAGAERIRNTEDYDETHLVLRKYGLDFVLMANYGCWDISKPLVTDAKGNEYTQMELVVTATWPSQVGEDIKNAIGPARFILKCCDQALTIKKEFENKKVYKLYHSIEETKKHQPNKDQSMVAGVDEIPK